MEPGGTVERYLRLKASWHMDSPAVSLLFCTRNRAEHLKACLEYIAHQNPSCSWELVIVDNGSTDDTAKVLSEYAAKVPFRTKILYEGRPGKSRGLNLALHVTRGDIIALIDDDCYVAPDYIDRVREVFADPRIGFAGGRVELFDPTDFPMTIQTSIKRELLPPRNYVEGGWILGANMMFRRSVLEAIGGFDLDFGPGTPFIAEDPDAQARASFAGWWGLYTPDVVVAHHHRRKAQDINELWRRYATGTGAYRMKFMLAGNTRLVFLRAWYWMLLRTLKGGIPARVFFWEVKGAMRYLVLRLRRRIVSAIGIGIGIGTGKEAF
jgi:glycosyltransferase involved in cell wall biosynthesis